MTREKPQAPEPTANYPAHPHEEMKRQVEEKFDPGLAGEIADEWTNIGSTLTDLAVDFQVIVNGSQNAWTGSAAEGARAALAKVGEFSDLTGDHFTATGTALHSQTTAASEAKARMPEPVSYDPKKMFTDAISSGNIVELAALPFTMPMQKAKSDGAKAEAIQVMQSRDDAMRSATSSMPAFAEMPTVTQEQGVATSNTNTSSVNTHTVEPTSRVGNGTGTTGTSNTGTGSSGTTNASWAPPPTVTPPPPVAPPVNLPPAGPPAPPITPPWAMPPGTKPPGSTPGRLPAQPGRHVPPPTTRPPGSGTPGRNPGGTGRTGGPGGPSGTGGGRPGMPGGPGGMSGGAGRGGFGPMGPMGPVGSGGQSGFGPTGTPNHAGAPGQGGRGGAGAPGAMGAGMGAAGGQGQGQGGEDLEHKAKYLIPTDEYFDDNRLVSPPTIGE
ncbi:hypothetical protein ACRAKI_08865 [Saccharothrix isguenensis]